VVKSTSENALPNSKHKKKNSDRLKKLSGKTVGAGSRAQVPGSHADLPAPANAVFLVGFMGAGKSSVGRTLGQLLNWGFEDLDHRIEFREGRSVAEIFRDSGESEFRQAEHNALKSLLEELRGGGDRVVALGGGGFVEERNASLLIASGAPTVFLDASVDELWRRCSQQASEAGAERPLLGSQVEFRRLYHARRDGYAKAGLRIATGERSVDEIAREIASKLGLRKVATRTEVCTEVRTEEGEVE
jgi:shikimate kinase